MNTPTTYQKVHHLAYSTNFPNDNMGSFLHTLEREQEKNPDTTNIVPTSTPTTSTPKKLTGDQLIDLITYSLTTLVNDQQNEHRRNNTCDAQISHNYTEEELVEQWYNSYKDARDYTNLTEKEQHDFERDILVMLIHQPLLILDMHSMLAHTLTNFGWTPSDIPTHVLEINEGDDHFLLFPRNWHTLDTLFTDMDRAYKFLDYVSEHYETGSDYDAIYEEGGQVDASIPRLLAKVSASILGVSLTNAEVATLAEYDNCDYYHLTKAESRALLQHLDIKRLGFYYDVELFRKTGAVLSHDGLVYKPVEAVKMRLS